MKIIGITGSSGAGKTTICDLLKENYNAYIIDADEMARKLSRRGTMYLQSIIDYFGPDIVDRKGELKRKELANLIYENDEKRNQLNDLTFTYVVGEIKEHINQLQAKELIVIDAPLLFESKLDQICDFVIGVIADEEEKIERICKRDKVSQDLAKKRLNIQKDNEFIKQNADYIIVNNSNIEDLKKEIAKIPLK